MDKVAQFLNAQPRNKIVFQQQEIPQLETVNLGLRLTEAIYGFKELGRVSMKVNEELEKLLHTSLLKHERYGRYLSIKNFGILFEQELKLDFTGMIDRHSQNNLLFVHWEGIIEQDCLYFLSKEEGIKTSIKHLSYIVI